ncbi:MAG: tRNA pseudouridine55 synthase [Solirubrobacteraceae bacterium]|nr:tRNA pseudouridine55 synthase [Solirubrobacteraceae bacterium]
MGRLADGVILWDKPAGITSHDVVARARGALGPGVRIGHAGTLDPFATGLLLVLVGRATRVQRFLLSLPKRYEAVARFGARSSTGDPDGDVVETGLVPDGDLALPTGRLRQRPPAYSAVHVDGERAYVRARRGEAVQVPEREVCVHRFEELWRRGDRRAFAIECSSGTYVRSLITALGDAYCEELRRTSIGPFALADADPEHVVPLPEALAFLPERRLSEDEARRASHGVGVPGQAEGPVRLTDAAGVVAVAEPQGGLLKPTVGFRG